MHGRAKKFTYWILFFFNLFLISNAFAVDRTVNLVVGYKTVNFAGKNTRAIAVNNQIPGPTLHFKEGDQVTIIVYNQLDIGTTIHWHGLLVPWQMDGVEGVTQEGIPPGKVFHYRFKLYQSGTYWYHAHAGFQEQEGLYGAIVIDPLKPPTYHYNKDYVIVLSDWINTPAAKVFANLKKDGDYYAPRFRLQPSLMKFIYDYRHASPQERRALMQDYKTMQHMRMSIYDFSDVAYDAFLLNGETRKHPWRTQVKVGDTVRLRFIGAAASTIYHIKIPGTTMQIMHIDGNDIKPYNTSDFTIAPGETYDVLVNIEKNIPYIIYAESSDTLGAAVGALLTEPNQLIDTHGMSFPEPLSASREMMNNMMGPMNHSGMNMEMPMKGMHSMPHMNMNMDMNMSMPTESTIIGDKYSPPNSSSAITIGTKYQHITAAVKTNDPDKPIYKIIHMELFGYMDHFMWFINGVPEYKAKPIVIEPGKRYRIIFTNTSMMHHPMHIHGHWFILRNGHGAYDPLLHTIDMAPGATAVADLDADASGQWFFHCHHLYHMFAGMARVFQYSTIIEISKGTAMPEKEIAHEPYANRSIVREDEVLPLNTTLIKHPMGHPPGIFFANFIDFSQGAFQNSQKANFRGLYGPDYNKLQLVSKDAEIDDGKVEDADIDIFYWHLISQFWAIKGGANYTYRPAITPYWQPGIGIEGMMPYFIDTDLRTYYHEGSVKFDLELSRDTQITNNFFIRAGVRSILATQTVDEAQIGSGLNQMRYSIRPYYRIRPGINIFAEYEYEQDYGPFKTLQRNDAEDVSSNIFTIGLAFLF